MKKIKMKLLILFVIIIFLISCVQKVEETNDLTQKELAELPEDLQPIKKDANLVGKATKGYDCQDSDAAFTFDKHSLLVKSTTTYMGGSFPDKCFSWSNGKTRLIEGICTQQNLDSKFNQWYFDCKEFGEKYKCMDGACVFSEEKECIDSDGGIDITHKGKITGFFPNSNQKEEVEDGCTGYYQVAEFYCDKGIINAVDSYMINGELATSGTYCPKDTFCKDGACVVPTCKDYPFSKHFICNGDNLINCKTNEKTNCLELNGYINQKKCGNKFNAEEYKCIEPCSPEQEVFICTKLGAFSGINIVYKLSCKEEKYGWFGWEWNKLSNCPSGTSCNTWIKGEEFDYAICH